MSWPTACFARSHQGPGAPECDWHDTAGSRYTLSLPQRLAAEETGSLLLAGTDVNEAAGAAQAPPQGSLSDEGPRNALGHPTLRIR
jgi:hypothetical protein